MPKFKFTLLIFFANGIPGSDKYIILIFEIIYELKTNSGLFFVKLKPCIQTTREFSDLGEILDNLILIVTYFNNSINNSIFIYNILQYYPE